MGVCKRQCFLDNGYLRGSNKNVSRAVTSPARTNLDFGCWMSLFFYTVQSNLFFNIKINLGIVWGSLEAPMTLLFAPHKNKHI